MKTAPALFTQAISRMLGRKYEDEAMFKKYGLADNYAVAYIDDIIVFSKTHEDHLEHVRDVLRNKTFWSETGSGEV